MKGQKRPYSEAVAGSTFSRADLVERFGKASWNELFERIHKELRNADLVSGLSVNAALAALKADYFGGTAFVVPERLGPNGRQRQ